MLAKAHLVPDAAALVSNGAQNEESCCEEAHEAALYANFGAKRVLRLEASRPRNLVLH